ncbi:RING finger protein [Quillaja saponaria]|uniref:RING finger protein n=1 Tax=Quillaja saponaria TaxID=32244 RepID=A0AAD7LKF4_QUISA|nr:RING finger protein [Quillaja saponaria]
MGKSSFKDSLKALEADIQHANTLALDCPRERDGARIQMRLSYSPGANLFLFLVRWTDCHLAGALGLLRILIYMTYEDGKTTLSVYERKASIRDFYSVIFPSLLQLQKGITDLEERKQKDVCACRYKRKDDWDKGKLTEIDLQREKECGICMVVNNKVVLPNCCHSLCLKCYQDWHRRSETCPFCRDSLERVKSADLWIYVDISDVIDLGTILKENSKRLFLYINKLPLVVPDHAFVHYDRRIT